MTEQGSSEPQPKQKEVAPNDTLKGIFKGISGTITRIPMDQTESYELPRALDKDSTPYAFHFSLRRDVAGLALGIDPQSESVERAEVIYSQQHVIPDISDEVLVPEIIVDVHIRTFIPRAEDSETESSGTAELDKHIIYRVREMQEDEYRADTSVEYRDPARDAAEAETPEDMFVDVELLSLESLVRAAEDHKDHSLAQHTLEDALHAFRVAEMTSHDLTIQEAGYLEAILHVLQSHLVKQG